MAACDSCLGVSKEINVVMNLFDTPLQHEEHSEEGRAICSEK